MIKFPFFIFCWISRYKIKHQTYRVLFLAIQSLPALLCTVWASCLRGGGGIKGAKLLSTCVHHRNVTTRKGLADSKVIDWGYKWKTAVTIGSMSRRLWQFPFNPWDTLVALMVECRDKHRHLIYYLMQSLFKTL